MAEPTLFDYIDAIAKILAAGGVVFGVWRGTQHLRLSREQKKLELRKADRASKTEEAKFWLELRSRFNEHKNIHIMLRNNEWPENSKDQPWPELEAYLGLMEHCEVMIHKGLLDFETFDDIYGYRVINAVAPHSVQKKLEEEKSDWHNLFALYAKICQKRGLTPVLNSPSSEREIENDA